VTKNDALLMYAIFRVLVTDDEQTLNNETPPTMGDF
jgi:hypothetical protein